MREKHLVQIQSRRVLRTHASNDTTLPTKRYQLAQARIGISYDSLFVLEHEVYLKFLSRVLDVAKRPDWAQYERFSFVSTGPGPSRTRVPEPWLYEFSEAYKTCLQFAVAEMAELLARWVTSNYRPGWAVHAAHILDSSFLLAEEFANFDFLLALVACVADKTKGPELPKVHVPLELAVHCYWVSDSLRHAIHDSPFSVSQHGMMLMPDPDKLKASVFSCLSIHMRNPIWKDRARSMAMQKIRLCAHLAPVARESRNGTLRLAIKLPPLTRQEIERQESLSVKQSAVALCIRERMVRTHFQKQRLDRTEAGRVMVNKKFWNQYNRKHGHPHSNQAN